MRECAKCHIERQDEEFRSGRKDCRACERHASREYGINNRDKRNKRLSRWRKENPDKARSGDRRDRLADYGLTEASFNGMVEEQQGLCRLCQRKAKLVIDHCHKTGRVRGLLCHRCNIALGWLETHPIIIRKLSAYVANETYAVDQPCHADVLLEIANK